MTCLHALHTHKYSPTQEYSLTLSPEEFEQGGLLEARDVFTAPSSALMAPWAGQGWRAVTSMGQLRNEEWVWEAREGPMLGTDRRREKA